MTGPGTDQYELVAPEPVPDGLLDAFRAYETALRGNDTEALNALFAPGPDTVRGDGKTLLAGHAAIAGFRSARTKIPTRRVAVLHVRVLGPDTALCLASTREPSNGATGLQTQVWRRGPAGWQVIAAHVTLPQAPGPALDTSVWRVAGDPLLSGAPDGPLRGSRVAVKDLFAVAGHPLGAGNPTWLAGRKPEPESAPVVSALLAAGADLAGIARTDEFAYSLAGANAHYGSPPNPAAPGAVSGGSTSGPASAVSLRQAEIGLGTDTAGSIRVPASYQGLVGLRTTHGAVDRTGLLPLAPSFDTVGWLTRDVATSARAAEVLLPAAARVPLTPTRTLRLSTVDRHARSRVAEAVEAAAARLAGEGVLPPIERGDLAPETLERWFHAFRTVQAREAWLAHGEWISAHPDSLGPDVAGRFETASRVTETDAQQASEVVAEARETLRELLAGAVLVLPASAGPAPRRDASAEEVEAERAGTLRMTCLAGLAGAPAVSLPLLDGPSGLCLVTSPGTDLDLLALAGKVLETRG
ncbi:amidase [Amycolatopsis cynarae]|uniref:Amidase n=1 Tax=Amycolatopsis cynarae TaxID=2995223 RepID=A0ABY7BA64_9PSEU|nr:amidase [Amycolatopsis sp. HUAS 11-8]WAL68855.1 amidase [Amycolatopsis sp. HUAS 11-8]